MLGGTGCRFQFGGLRTLPRGPIGDWISQRDAHRCEMPPVEEWTANYVIHILISISYL